jgi:arginine/lysine/ornithine decarboxylase
MRDARWFWSLRGHRKLEERPNRFIKVAAVNPGQFTAQMTAQAATPLLDALRSYLQAPTAAFHAPGHNRGRRIPECIETLVGALPYRVDFPDLPGLNLFEKDGAISQAQGLAAELFGAERTWFLIDGSTVGILASILATCRATSISPLFQG